MSKRKHAIEAHFQHGLRLHQTGRLAEAEQVYRHVLAATPSHAETLHMLGVLALQCGQPGIALVNIDQAIALRPATAMYHVNRANALLALGEKEAAAAACHNALRLKRNCAEAHQVLGHALADQGKTDSAIEAYRAALHHNPNLPGLHNNLGLVLRQAGQLETAATHLRQALTHEPSDVQAQNNLAGLLKELGRLKEADALYREALRRSPGDPGLHYNLGLVSLLAGRLDEGWREYEWRFRAGTARMQDCPQPRWQGEPLNGRTLLVRAEQGFGDTIQFCRFAPLVTGGNVILEVQPPLRRLIAGLQSTELTVCAGDHLTDFDLYVPLLSLPPLLGFTGVNPPYLQAEPDLIAAWSEALGHRGFTIGIAWQGNPASQAELGRSCPLAALRPLASLPGVRLISLQKHHGLAQLPAASAAGLRIETPHLDAGPDAFVDTVAMMGCLDLIITSDTSIAHLAGALGRPVWVALQHVPDWRWQLEREDCPWYPSMRLFRQTRRGDWDDVFTRITAAVAELMPA